MRRQLRLVAAVSKLLASLDGDSYVCGMAGLLESFWDQFSERDLLPKRGGLVVAVSGGVDSVVLLDLLSMWAHEHGKRLVVAHFNHGLRGRSSDADERLVRRIARRLRLRCIVGRGDVQAFARREGVSVEMAARELRHRFLARTARRVGSNTIATAHHADDQVELFFLRLLRGASPKGLSGMSDCEPSPADARLTVIRPLLHFRKAELRAWARTRTLEFREDRSNRSHDFLRNRVRLELLPLLRRKYQPAVDDVVLRTMDMIDAESAVIRGLAVGWLGLKKRTPFSALPVGLKRAVVARQLTVAGVAPEFDLVERLCLEADTPVMVSAGVCVRRDCGGLIRRTSVEKAAFDQSESRVDVSRSGAVTFGGVKLTWTRRRVRDWKLVLARRSPNTEILDAEKIGSSVTLRHWRPGDRFQAFGMMKPTKLQDWFVNRKVPAAQRRKLVLAEAAGGVLCWVEGQRLAEQCKLSAETREVLVWRWRRTA